MTKNGKEGKMCPDTVHFKKMARLWITQNMTSFFLTVQELKISYLRGGGVSVRMEDGEPGSPVGDGANKS
jgi:hypothetical protein